MDLKKALERIRQNLFIIPPERFDTLAADRDFSPSAFHLLICLLFSVPIDLALAALGNSFFQALLSVPASLVVSVMLSYLLFSLQHLFLKLVGGKAPLLQSVQVFIYGNTVSLIFGGLPIIGFLTMLVSLVNVVQGSARIHKIPLWRSALALVILPGALIALVLLYIFFFVATPSGTISPPR